MSIYVPLHMTKTQAANVIGRLPIIPFMGKGAPVKTETKTESRKSEPTTTMTTTMTATTQETTTRTTDMAEQEKTTEVQVTPGMPLVVEIDTNLEKEIDIEKDVETSKKAMKTTGETVLNQKRSNNTIDTYFQGKEKSQNKKLMRQSRI